METPCKYFKMESPSSMSILVLRVQATAQGYLYVLPAVCSAGLQWHCITVQCQAVQHWGVQCTQSAMHCLSTVFFLWLLASHSVYPPSMPPGSVVWRSFMFNLQTDRPMLPNPITSHFVIDKIMSKVNAESPLKHFLPEHLTPRLMTDWITLSYCFGEKHFILLTVSW